MAQSAEAKSTATTSTPSPHLEPALPPVRDLALAALLGSENPTASTSDLRAQQQMACFPSGVQAEFVQPATGLSNGQDLAAQPMQQLLLLQRLQQLQQQTALLQMQQVLCAQALGATTPQTSVPAVGKTQSPDMAQLLLLQQLSVLPHVQQMAAVSPQLNGLSSLPGVASVVAAAGIGSGPSTSASGCQWQESSVRRALRANDTGNSSDKEYSGRRKFHGKAAVAYLQKWLYANIKNPYPSLDLKRMLARTSGLTEAQVDHWFNNARKRIIKGRKLKKENVGVDTLTLDDPAAAVPTEKNEMSAALALQDLANKELVDPHMLAGVRTLTSGAPLDKPAVISKQE